MRAYLGTTGLLWAVLAVAHIARTVSEWNRLPNDLGFMLEVPGIGVLAAALCVWAWRLFAQAAPRTRTS